MTIFGSDVSHFDGPDTRAMFADGIVFQTHKAGGDADDAELAAWWFLVKGYRPRVLLGAYWVLYPGNPVGRADSFIARLDSQCPGWRDGPFLLQADCEKWNNDVSTVPPVSEVNAFCDRLTLRLPKLRPVGYLPDWVYGDLSAFRYPLWSSKYVTGAGSPRTLYPGDGARQWAAYGGKTPAILQFTSSATIGGQSTCDANAFRGTLQELTRLVAPGWTEDDVATKDDVIAGLVEYFGMSTGAPYTSTQPDQLKENLLGVRTFGQPLPNVFRTAADGTVPRTSAWVLLTDIAAALESLPSARETAAAVLAALGTADLDGAAAALRAVLGDERSRQLGALLTS